MFLFAPNSSAMQRAARLMIHNKRHCPAIIKKTPFSNPKILIGTANRIAGSGPARLSGPSVPSRWYTSCSLLIRNWPVSARLNAVPQYLCPSDAWEYAVWIRYFSPFEVSTSSLDEKMSRTAFIRMKAIRKNICNRFCENDANLAGVKRACTGLGLKKFHNVSTTYPL